MRILVTGGAGFIGSHVCERLLARGDRVVCVDNLNDYYDPKIKEKNIQACRNNKNFAFYKADIVDFEALKKIFEKENIEKVLHLAARAGVRPSIQQPRLYEEVNVGGTIKLLELSKAYEINNFVFASSSSVYGSRSKVPFKESDPCDKPISPYAATKRAGELLCYTYHQLYGMNVACLRFFTVYGPRGRPDMAVYKFTKAIDSGDKIQVYGDGSAQRDLTYVEDIVQGIVAALDKGLEYEIINLGNDNPVKVNYLIELIEKSLGKKALREQVGEQIGDVPITCADISKATKLLGYEPKTSIESGIEKFVRWYKENGK